MFDDVIVNGEIKTISEKNLKFQKPIQDNRLYKDLRYKNIKIYRYKDILV